MKKSLFTIALTAFLFTGCGPKMTGTWNVDRYAVDNQQGRSMNTTNAGTITIKKNGTGEKDINYNMFQTEFSDTQSFRWTMPDENIITISSNNNTRNSDLDKTWIIVSQKKKNQIWKSTDGKNTIQTLELSKK